MIVRITGPEDVIELVVHDRDTLKWTLNHKLDNDVIGTAEVYMEFRDELPECRADVDEGKLQGERVLSSGTEGDGRDEVEAGRFMERWDDDGGALG